MTIKDYYYLLLPSSMKRKENSDAFKWTNAIGGALDVLMENIFRIRTQSIVSTAKGNGLVMLGKDEELEKLVGESEEEFRQRILSIKAIKSGFITKATLELAIKTLGYNGAEVRQCYLEKYKANPDPARAARWAEFEVAIPSASYLLTANDRARIQYVLDTTKPGWTKGNIVYKCLTVGQVDSMTLRQLQGTKIREFRGAMLP